VLEEARHDYGLMVIGGGRGASPFGELLADVVGDAPCHVAVVTQRGEEPGPYKKILLPVDGRAPGRVAAELAGLYASRTGAEITVVRYEEPGKALGEAKAGNGHGNGNGAKPSDAGDVLDRIAPALKAMNVKVEIIARAGGIEPILEELRTGHYDLLMLGVENRALQQRLFFGHDTERLVEASPVSVAILVPARPGAAA
jgi:nucleotide-binding universal stress UspA family protein